MTVARVFEVDKAKRPYVFDSQTGQFSAGAHDFSADLVSASRGDADAHARAMEFIATQFAVTAGNVAAVNPNAHRADAYVEQRDYQHPLWDTCRNPPLPDGRPFTIPLFGSALDLVSDHTEGAAPADGAFTVTSSGVITPQPMSGAIEITRETWDAAGDPRVSGLIWGRMVAAYLDACEQALAAALTAAAGSITDIPLAAAGADAALVNQLLDAFPPLAFLRGGTRFQLAALHIDLHGRLAAAKDSAGRKLLTRGPGQTLDLGGITGAPTWALGATSEESSNSWLIDPNAVHAWATPPQRLEFNSRVEYVDLAIFGYRAIKIADTTGLRQITYTP